MKIAIATVAVTVGLASVACTQIPTDSRYDPENGWRRGKVDALLLTQAAALSQTAECRSEYSAMPPQTLFAKIHYVRYGNTIIHRIVPQPSSLELKLGDAVHVNVDGCAGQLVKADS